VECQNKKKKKALEREGEGERKGKELCSYSRAGVGENVYVLPEKDN